MTTNDNVRRPVAPVVGRTTRETSGVPDVLTVRSRLGSDVLRSQSLDLPEGLTYKAWADYGKALARMEHNVMWWIGDWWRYGVRHRYGEAQQVAASTGFALQSVKAAAWVATRFNEPSRRRDDLSFFHHREVASLPDKEADTLLAQAAAERWSTKRLRSAVRQRRHAARLGLATRHAAANLEQLGRFAVILADPPWRFRDAEPSRSVENHYHTMDLADICALVVPAADEAVLFLWVPPTHLRTGLAVTDAWGFEYKTNFVWDKVLPGMGHYSRLRHEHVLFATRGNLPPPLPADRSESLFQFRRGAHSAKPDAMHDIIERAYPLLPKIELFARSQRPGWVAWGDQAPGLRTGHRTPTP